MKIKKGERKGGRKKMRKTNWNRRVEIEKVRERKNIKRDNRERERSLKKRKIDREKTEG